MGNDIYIYIIRLMRAENELYKIYTYRVSSSLEMNKLELDV